MTTKRSSLPSGNSTAPTDFSRCQVVILCGGRGVRLREKTVAIPKPLVEVGPHPILWHLMKIFESQGFTRFVLCLGYKGDQIEDYVERLRKSRKYSHWEVILARTGLDTPTGGRVHKIAKHIDGDDFMLTYADGLADVDLRNLLRFHAKHGRVGTVTAVNPRSPFGEMMLRDDGTVDRFAEKPLMKQWINGGFFVFKRDFVKTIAADEVLEQEPLERLARSRELVAQRHHGFWKCMDTYKDLVDMRGLWAQPRPPWKTW